MDLHSQRPNSRFGTLLSGLAQRGVKIRLLEKHLSRILKVSPSEIRMMAAAILVTSLIIALTQCGKSREHQELPPQELTTHIPHGFVLVPIQLKNFESVDSILGPFGLVDLFSNEKMDPSKLIVRNIKILRAPKNPSLFAVLAPQERASTIIQADEKGLYAVLKNNNEGGTEFVTTSKKRSRITYETEER